MLLIKRSTNEEWMNSYSALFYQVSRKPNIGVHSNDINESGRGLIIRGKQTTLNFKNEIALQNCYCLTLRIRISYNIQQFPRCT